MEQLSISGSWWLVVVWCRSGKVDSNSDFQVVEHNFTAYCVSKGDMKMLTRNLAVELGALGITINNVAPGAILLVLRAFLSGN
jgi:NAD(P)-dependent dehydrogenase (short-subunit alcohol dehydrogenase family)